MYVTVVGTLFSYNKPTIKKRKILEGEKDMSTKRFYKQWPFYVILAATILIGIVATFYIQSSVKSDNNIVEIAVVESNPEYISYTAVAGKTSLDQLKESTSDVQTKTTEYGEYVDTIGSLIGGTDGKYWTFYIDGEMASVGAGSYTQKGGEKIEWKFVNLQ